MDEDDAAEPASPYERYYAERAEAGVRTAIGPWIALALLVPAVLAVAHVVPVGEEPADASATHRAVPVGLAVPPATTAGDGRFEVGSDLVEGVYGSPGPAAGTACRYVRLSGSGREVTRAVVRGPAAMHLVAGETVRLSGGCRWTAR